jgi:hypothetical protein
VIKLETIGYIFNVIAGFVIIPIVNWIKPKATKIPFLPPLLALILALIFVALIDFLLKAHLTIEQWGMMVFGQQFISQLGYEATKPKIIIPPA